MKTYECSVTPMWSGWILAVGIPMRKRDLLRKMAAAGKVKTGGRI